MRNAVQLIFFPLNLDPRGRILYLDISHQHCVAEKLEGMYHLTVHARGGLKMTRLGGGDSTSPLSWPLVPPCHRGFARDSPLSS